MTKIIASTKGTDEITVDAALLQRAQLNSGDHVSVELHPGGGLTITPSAEISSPNVSELIESTMDRYSETMKRLA